MCSKMTTSEKNKEIIALIKREVVPALGCTEPIAVALAVAKARETLGQEPQQTEVWVSGNIYKNGIGVGIPGTGMIGLDIAAALGTMCGSSANGLEVLKDVNEELVNKAKRLVADKKITVKSKKTDEKLYIEATCKSATDTATAIIEKIHNSITLVIKNGTVVEKKSAQSEEKSATATNDFDVSIKEIYEFATTVPFSDIAFILDGARMNKKLSDFGLEYKPGLGIAASLQHRSEMRNCQTFEDKAIYVTAAASEARMSGAMLPAMSNSGSGNQGITAMLPVLVAAEHFNSGEEQLARALLISNLTVIHIKKTFGRLSAACGCVVASTGSACGITYLMGGTEEQIEFSIKNMVANLTGLICDGAKLGCALKVATGTSAAIQSALLAMDNVCVTGTDGIIDDDVEKTIHNIGIIASEGMNETDAKLLEIMMCK